MKEIKALVVFYSRTGITKKVAYSIAEKLHCDKEEILSIRNRMGFFGFMVCGFEAIFKKTASIKETKINPGEYEIVIIGSPIWASNISSPVRTYLVQHSKNFRKVAFFCTAQSSGSDKAFQNMQAICEKEPLALLELTEDNVNKEDYVEKIKVFANRITLNI